MYSNSILIIIIIIILLIINISSWETFQPSPTYSCDGSSHCVYWDNYFKKQNEYNKYYKESYNVPTFNFNEHEELIKNLNDSTIFNIQF